MFDVRVMWLWLRVILGVCVFLIMCFVVVCFWCVCFCVGGGETYVFDVDCVVLLLSECVLSCIVCVVCLCVLLCVCVVLCVSAYFESALCGYSCVWCV